MENILRLTKPFYTNKKIKTLSHFANDSAVKITVEIFDEHYSELQEKNIHSIKTQNFINKIEKCVTDFYDTRENNQLIIDQDNQQLKFGNNKIKLTYLELSLMVLLNNKPNRTFTRDQIIELAYHQSRDITDRAIDSHIKNLRKKIRTLGVEDVAIESVYGVGYRYLSVC